MLIVLSRAMAPEITAKERAGVRVVGWYWHLGDAVGGVVFFVVYSVSTRVLA
jgi:heme/copper-type cytochrome/quinol oxidase subunit 3